MENSNNKKLFGSLEKLNSEIIILEIVSRLPIDSVLRCTLACKNWQTLLTNAYFKDMHRFHQLQILKQLDDDDNDHKYHPLRDNINGAGGAFAAMLGLGLLVWIHDERHGILRLHYGEFYHEITNMDHGDYESKRQHDDQYSSYKQLFTRIDHPPIKKQPKRINALVEPNKNSVVGSCNGLICLSERHHNIDDPVYIFNPITREYIDIPKYQEELYDDCMVCGFGYHPSTNQYKVVRIYYDPFEESALIGHIQVYTLGDGRGWRDIGQVNYTLLPSPGIAVNGALHWLDIIGNILSLDLGSEEFRLLPSPPCVRPRSLDHLLEFYQLRNFGGCLCFVDRDEQGVSLDIWSFKKKTSSVDREKQGGSLDIWSFNKKQKISSHDVKEQDHYHSWCWTWEFNIAQKDLQVVDNHYEPFALTKSGEILLRQNLKTLSLYDPKTASVKKLLDVDTGLTFFGAMPHMNSFVSLKDLGENSKRLSRTSKVYEEL